MMIFIYRFLILVVMNFSLASSSTQNGILMRCYCNLPECTSDSTTTIGETFSCKSRTGCFQELPHYNLPQPIYRRLNQATDLRYGCLELWPSDSAPFQCTEPGIRKSPAGIRRPTTDYDFDELESLSEIDSRSTGRRRTGSNRHYGQQQNKLFKSKQWNAYDIPLRCCFGDMCNRKRTIISSPDKKSDHVTLSSIVPDEEKLTLAPTVIDHQTPPTSTVLASHQWWLTSTMVFVPIIGCLTFFLLVLLGCWILHFGGPRTCRRSTTKEKDILIPAHYFYDHHDGKKSTFNFVVVETTNDSASTNGTVGRWVHIPISLSKYNCVVNVKSAASTKRTLLR